MQAKKLIEVAMPIKEISAESVRDKSIRSGHISTLHLWWARRPLPVCRAVVFASLVPDPMDEHCPTQFSEAIELLLGSASKPLKDNKIPSDAFKPYDDIPYTAAIDKMEDNLRNRLLMFIGKFSPEYALNEKIGKKTPTAKLISNYSLIKWENKNNEFVLSKAKKLIWVAHNSKSGTSLTELLSEYEEKDSLIKKAEQGLYSLQNRHIETEDSKRLSANLSIAIEAFLEKMPKVFDPFAGGGAIPLEAARLGCRSYGNDINPVAHIIQKGSLEYPQKYGKPITYSKMEFLSIYGEKEWNKILNEDLVFRNGEAVGVSINNRLQFDVNFYSRQILELAESKCGIYHLDDLNLGKPLVYYWVKVGICSNPSCGAKVPLLKQFYLSKKRTEPQANWIHLKPIVSNNEISFEIKKGKIEIEGWISRGNLVCPCCGNITDVRTLKQQFKSGQNSERLVAIIFEKEGKRSFRIPNINEIRLVESISRPPNAPIETMPVKYTQAMPSCTWGISKWGDLFNNRQLITINALIESVKDIAEKLPESDYKSGVVLYLSILIDRILAEAHLLAYGIFFKKLLNILSVDRLSQ